MADTCCRCGRLAALREENARRVEREAGAEPALAEVEVELPDVG